MVKGFEVVHMGGRTYNPFIGRFMQPDPFIQAPLNMQNYNRYSYVLNNPMSYTDPSGYNFLKKGLKFVMKATGSWYVHKFIAQNQLLSGIVNVGLNFIPGCQVWCSAVFSAEQAFVTTGSLRAGIKAGAISAASSYAFQQIGSYYETNAAGNISFGGNMMTSGQIAGQITTHAMVGGVTASLQGGKFGHGFFAAGVTKGLGTPLLDATASQNVVAGTVISATIGGTASVIAGGKFANGAVTGAMQALYNYYRSKRAEYHRRKKSDFDLKPIMADNLAQCLETTACATTAAGALTVLTGGGSTAALLAGRTALAGRLGTVSLFASSSELTLNYMSDNASMVDFASFSNHSAVYALDKVGVPLLPAPIRLPASIMLDSYQHTSTYLFNEASRNHGN